MEISQKQVWRRFWRSAVRFQIFRISCWWQKTHSWLLAFSSKSSTMTCAVTPREITSEMSVMNTLSKFHCHYRIRIVYKHICKVHTQCCRFPLTGASLTPTTWTKTSMPSILCQAFFRGLSMWAISLRVVRVLWRWWWPCADPSGKWTSW